MMKCHDCTGDDGTGNTTLMGAFLSSSFHEKGGEAGTEKGNR